MAREDGGRDAEMPRVVRRDVLAAAIVSASVALVLLLTRLGQIGLRGDEGFYAMVASSILRSGDPFHLTLEGQPFLNKPPLAFWAMAASSKVLGLSEFSLRLPSVLATLALTAVVFRTGCRRSSAWPAALAVVLFVAAPHALYYHGWRSAVTEPWMALWTLLTLRTYSASTPRRSTKLVVLTCLNALSKGLVGPILVIVTAVAAEIVLDRRLAPVQRRKTSFTNIASAGLLILAPALVTYFGWWLWNEPDFTRLTQFLHHDWLLRATGQLQASHVQPWYHLIVRALRDFDVWWALFALAALPASWRRMIDASDREGLAYILLPLATLGLFSLSASKIAWYVYPAYPAAGIVVADAASRIARTRRVGVAARALFVIAVATLSALRVANAFRGLPRPSPASLAALSRIVDERPHAEVYFDPRLRDRELRPREWNRFTIFHRLDARPWTQTAGAADGHCRFLVTPDPASARPKPGPSAAEAVIVTPQARSKREPPLFVLDLCRGAFASSVPSSSLLAAPSTKKSDR